MKKIDSVFLESINGGYDCTTGHAWAIGLATWGGLSLNAGALVGSAAITALNLYYC